MTRDRFDILLLAGLLGCGLLLAFLLLGADSQASAERAAIDRAMERELAYQAKLSFLQRLYAPVVELRQAGQSQAALLKLDELARKYPEEAHGEILRGAILYRMGALNRAVEHYERGVRLNGDYVDKGSPLSQRAEIARLLEEGLPQVKQRSQQQPDGGQQATLKSLYYLQSRLAGGCE